ncbi:nuclear transport factor 2 family protein [Brachybacterium squillarum]|uniref:nuclear transport factor 2 family protein n=1 Tax=Brachybacterium squillarum TaxID=661979 RepID=UPI0002629646|nr:nuclear transport factor 2 family protein [Brachybacterium squillarum]
MTEAKGRYLPSILQFYGEHFSRIDEGDIKGWALDFESEAEFSSPTAELASADEIREKAVAAHRSRRERGVVNRHLQSAVHILHSTEDSAEVRSYVLVVAVEPDGSQPTLLSTVMQDHLVRTTCWKVRRREITFDGR